jgi:regulatory factor X
MQVMRNNIPLDFLPLHSRSASVSSSSSNSRPSSSQGPLSHIQTVLPPSADDLYRSPYSLNGSDHVCLSQQSPPLSALIATLFTQSPPNHNISNPALKGPLRPSHLRARAAASPYPRDTDSVHSSSSETEDISLFLTNPTHDYHSMYGGGHTMAPSQETMHAAGAFGRMTLGPDHALEKLAANVRAATTTSASDRAKQIFVQAWCILHPLFQLLSLINP